MYARMRAVREITRAAIGLSSCFAPPIAGPPPTAGPPVVCAPKAVGVEKENGVKLVTGPKVGVTRVCVNVGTTKLVSLVLVVAVKSFKCVRPYIFCFTHLDLW